MDQVAPDTNRDAATLRRAGGVLLVVLGLAVVGLSLTRLLVDGQFRPVSLVAGTTAVCGGLGTLARARGRRTPSVLTSLTIFLMVGLLVLIALKDV